MNIILSRETLAQDPGSALRWLPKLLDDATFLRANYPKFDSWLLGKVLPGLQTGERSILFEVRESTVAGVCIVKHSAEEKKLCTLRIRPEFESRGLGVRLFERAFEMLGTEQPLLSVSEATLRKFARLFEHFNFTRKAIYDGLYLPTISEFSYNGVLDAGLGPVINFAYTRVRENAILEHAQA